MPSQDPPAASTAPPSSDDAPSSPASTTPAPTPRFLALQAKHAALTATLADLQTQRAALAATTTLPSGLPLPAYSTPEETLAVALKSSNEVIKEHISLLHKYNEIKDVGQGLMGLIADKRGCRVLPVMEEFGVAEGD
nr:hypothetical protein B0A51_11659 [Rachicladosporium sp. CCFEE 5018]